MFDFTIYALQVCFSFLPTYELHIRLSSRKRKKHNIFIALVRIHKYHIYWHTWECHTKKSLSFILKTYKNSKTVVKQRNLTQVKVKKPHGWSNMSKFKS
jgi:hypothetical protein